MSGPSASRSSCVRSVSYLFCDFDFLSSPCSSDFTTTLFDFCTSHFPPLSHFLFPLSISLSLIDCTFLQKGDVLDALLAQVELIDRLVRRMLAPQISVCITSGWSFVWMPVMQH